MCCLSCAGKQSPDGVLKMKRLRKLVLKTVRESGITEDETKLGDMLEHKVSRHLIDCAFCLFMLYFT